MQIKCCYFLNIMLFIFYFGKKARTSSISKWFLFLETNDPQRLLIPKVTRVATIGTLRYIHTGQSSSTFWWPFYFKSRRLKFASTHRKINENRSISLLVKTFVKNIMRVRIWSNPTTTSNLNCLFRKAQLMNLRKVLGLNTGISLA